MLLDFSVRRGAHVLFSPVMVGICGGATLRVIRLEVEFARTSGGGCHLNQLPIGLLKG